MEAVHLSVQPLMKKLGVSAAKVKMSLSILEKINSPVDSYLVRDLPSCPISMKMILSSYRFYIADIGLLIANDIPEALDPVEIRHGDHDGPYASRTRIGWAVNGPLRRSRGETRIVSSFIKVDPQFQQMVEDFYSRDFTDIFFDDTNEMSQNERRFMRNTDKIKFKDGHNDYEISQRFKSGVTSIHNNKSQALARNDLLNKMLMKDPKLRQGYKGFMSELVAKGYARRVHLNQVIPEDSVVYTPPRCIPNKIRVVFDCSAQFKGLSLNSMLYKGPDLTNSLVGVLTRFREDRIAVMAA